MEATLTAPDRLTGICSAAERSRSFNDFSRRFKIPTLLYSNVSAAVKDAV